MGLLCSLHRFCDRADPADPHNAGIYGRDYPDDPGAGERSERPGKARAFHAFMCGRLDRLRGLRGLFCCADYDDRNRQDARGGLSENDLLFSRGDERLLRLQPDYEMYERRGQYPELFGHGASGSDPGAADGGDRDPQNGKQLDLARRGHDHDRSDPCDASYRFLYFSSEKCKAPGPGRQAEPGNEGASFGTSGGPCLQRL